MIPEILDHLHYSTTLLAHIGFVEAWSNPPLTERACGSRHLLNDLPNRSTSTPSLSNQSLGNTNCCRHLTTSLTYSGFLRLYWASTSISTPLPTQSSSITPSVESLSRISSSWISTPWPNQQHLPTLSRWVSYRCHFDEFASPNSSSFLSSFLCCFIFIDST